MSDKHQGIYRKFVVHRVDGTDKPGGKHDGCEYFVLDLNHDLHALRAIEAYAESCRHEYPKLAADLLEKAKRIRATRRSAFDLVRAIERAMNVDDMPPHAMGALSFGLAAISRFEE